MTPPPVLTAVPPTIHRRSLPPTVDKTTLRIADRVHAALRRNEPLMVAVDGHGRGWWVISAKRDGCTVRRHGATMPVAWTAIQVDG